MNEQKRHREYQQGWNCSKASKGDRQEMIQLHFFFPLDICDRDGRVILLDYFESHYNHLLIQ